MKIIFYSSLLALFLTPPGSLQAQSNQAMSDAEEKLKELFDSTMEPINDEERIILGDQFSKVFQQTLAMDESFEHSFSLLPNVAKLTSPEERFRIYTWNIPLHSGMNLFYGLIQLKSVTKDSLSVIELVDYAEKVADPHLGIFSPERWFGAIYYKMITRQTMYGGVFYTLLGWRGENMLVTTKLIEILTVTSAGEILFGKPLFCHYGETKPSRILFHHSANATMSLRYEEQWVVVDKKWNARRKEFEFNREKIHMIVTDRLVPSDPQLEGQYEYYLPAGDVMDGFIFKDGCWSFIEQIDARNPAKK
ncbi:MAG: hypothetical protein HQ542_07985 [Bacteroidia bacterium]|nr:hypothetical protein [Bacteroidia bacterium]